MKYYELNIHYFILKVYQSVTHYIMVILIFIYHLIIISNYFLINYKLINNFICLKLINHFFIYMEIKFKI